MSSPLMEIYPMIRKNTGNVPDRTMLAQVELDGAGIRITCYDEKLKEQLRDIFSMPIIRRIPTDRRSGVITHQNEAVKPFTEEFFNEVLYLLPRRGLHGVLR